jgi:hypothetical protein
MKSYIFTSLLLLTFLTISQAALDLGLEKLKKIQELESVSSGAIIIFNDKYYEELVLQNPRPYDVVMLYTVG